MPASSANCARADEAAVVRAIVQLVAALGRSVVAEGSESADQLSQLRDIATGAVHSARASTWAHR